MTVRVSVMVMFGLGVAACSGGSGGGSGGGGGAAALGGSAGGGSPGLAGSTGGSAAGAGGVSTGSGGSGVAGGGAAGRGGAGGTAAGAGGGAAGASGGSPGAGGMVCTSTDARCTNGAVFCGNACCQPGEWCDNSTNLPHCRCGTTGAGCTAPDLCGAPTSACGVVCCGSAVGCPKSRRAEKRDIEAVSDTDRLRLYDELRGIQLRTYRYKDEPTSAPRRLGFIIDDTRAPEAINGDGNTVNLYGYISMAVAALQTQAKEIEELRAKVRSLENDARRSKSASRSTTERP